MERVLPRKPRLHIPGSFNHVILRGNARRNIYVDEADRLLWQKLICEGIELWQHRVHAHCWMTNHVHMAIQASDSPLSSFIGTLASRYAKAFNKKYRRSGHLFERRYRAMIVQEDKYLLELVRYIHQNPLRARMVSELSEYRWSSHRAYSGAECPSFLTIGTVLSLFGNRLRIARHQYSEFMRESPPPLVLHNIRVGSSEDDRSLGDDDWCKRVLKNARQQSDCETLDQLIERRCEQYGFTEAELASASRARDRANMRGLIALEATDRGLASVTEIAKRFGRSQPALSRAISRRRRQNKL
jgi:REP element-mobilizing transposase RayT